MSLIDLITIQKLSAAVKRRARNGEIVYLFFDSRPGWSAPLPFYIFACPNQDCVNHERLAIDYAHGFKNHNRQVICPLCGQKKYFPTTPISILKKIKLIFLMRKIFKTQKKKLLDERK